MNVKIMSLAIVFAIVIGSFGAVGTQNENENDCACGVINSSGYVSDGSQEHYTGLVEPENWREGARFDPCDNPTDEGLPSSFDWRNQVSGSSPSIKDQGSCGSCWAFATVGVLEWNIKIKDYKLVDLSEQWLVSCTNAGSCSGGWWAHDYHLDSEHPACRTDPCWDSGAVLESNFPYTAADDPCNCPYTHNYYIEDWAYIGDQYSIPSVDAIKYAIYNYGPVCSAVFVNSAFHEYTGGIFDQHVDEKINHAVVLMGWNDNNGNGYWILKNSWGTDWGENGYMRIKYGTNRIGYSANYVEYEGKDHILKCEGNLNFETAKVGTPVKRSFTVENTHPDPQNRLHWKADTSVFPDSWEWSVNPSEETGLRPIDGKRTVTVTITVPDRSKVRKLDGNLKVYNVGNPDDYELLKIYLTTPRNRHFSNSLILRFFDDFPMLKYLFSNFLLYLNSYNGV